MNVPLRSIRRATLDDLPTLHSLWQLENLAAADLDRRFKEFQVAESDTGEVLGILGVHVVGTEARIHSEVFAHFEYADELRRKFWERLKVMAENQGWVRLWTQHSAQGWRECGFDPPSSEQMAKLPDPFSHLGTGHWFVLQLCEERCAAPSVDAEFQLLKLTHQVENEQLLKRAKTFRILAMFLVGSVVLWVGWWGLKLFRSRDQLPRR